MASARVMPEVALPPIARSPDWAAGTWFMRSDSRDSRPTLNTATSRSAAAPTSSAHVGTSRASTAVTAEPAIAPSVAPAAMTPKSRLPCSAVKTSTIVCQKIDTTKRLKTESQTKKNRPIQTACSGPASVSATAKSRMLRAKKR